MYTRRVLIIYLFKVEVRIQKYSVKQMQREIIHHTMSY